MRKQLIPQIPVTLQVLDQGDTLVRNHVVVVRILLKRERSPPAGRSLQHDVLIAVAELELDFAVIEVRHEADVRGAHLAQQTNDFLASVVAGGSVPVRNIPEFLSHLLKPQKRTLWSNIIIMLPECNPWVGLSVT